jgi:hypothetical protein
VPHLPEPRHHGVVVPHEVSSLVVPTTYYLDTSAVSGLRRCVNEARRVEGVRSLVGQNLLVLYSSGLTVQELLQNGCAESRTDDLELLRGLTSRLVGVQAEAPGWHEQVRQNRNGPWLVLSLHLRMLTVAKCWLRGTKPDSRRNDAYDLIHVLSASFADAIVTQDGDLRRAIACFGDAPTRTLAVDEWLDELERDHRPRCVT